MSETMIPNWPDAIKCGTGSEPGAVFFLQAGNSEGYYTQVFPYELKRVWFYGNGNYGGSSVNDDSTRGCLGKSIEQLYERDEAFDLLSSKPFDTSNTMIQGWPDAIQCGYDNADGAVFFLRAISESEGAVYTQIYSSENRMVRFDLDGSFNSRTGTELVSGGCHGKSIEELSLLNRTFSLLSPEKTIIPDWPDAIICGSGDDVKSIFYLHAASNNGGRYVQPYNNEYRYINFNGDGSYESMSGNELATRACVGQSIYQLYVDKKAVNFVNSPAKSNRSTDTKTTIATTTSTDNAADKEGVVSETMLPDWPDAIRCGAEGFANSVFFLNRGTDLSDTTAWYVQIHADEFRYVRFNSDGSYYTKDGNDDSARGCLGQSIEQLYESGRAFNLVGSTQATTTEEASTTNAEDETAVDVVYSEDYDSGYSEGFIAGMVVLGAGIIGVAVAAGMYFSRMNSGSADFGSTLPVSNAAFNSALSGADATDLSGTDE